MAARHPLADWRFWVKVAVSLAIAFVLGWLVQDSGIDLIPSTDELAVLLVCWWGFPAFILCQIVVHVLRAYRWVYLLRPLAVKPIGMAKIIAVAFFGFLAIMILPLRTGELARPYLISTRGEVGLSAGFGTIAIERVIDGLILSAILTVCLVMLPLGDDKVAWAWSIGGLTAAIFVGALVVLLFLLWKGEPTIAFIERVGARIWPRASRKVSGVLREFLFGLAALPDRKHLIPFVLMSLVYWGLNGVSMWFLARVCGLDLSLIGGFTVMTLLAVGILLPTGPGHFGNFQVSVATALTLENLPQGQLEGPGSVLIFALYAGMFGITIVAGLGALMTEHITLSRVMASSREAPEAAPGPKPALPAANERQSPGS